MTLHCMLDLETLDTSISARIVSIGLCFFDLEGTIEIVETILVDDPNGTVDAGTVEWWMSQSAAARAATFAADGRLPLRDALRRFFDLCCANGARTLWSNGPTFDEMILRTAWTDRAGLQRNDFPFTFRASRDCRTAFKIAAGLGVPRARSDDHVAHSAGSDAREQARSVVNLFRFLNLTEA